MSRFVFIIFIVISLGACSPVIKTNQDLCLSDPHLLNQCGQPFVKEPWRFVHKIEASLPMGKHVTMIGVTRIDPGQITLQGVLMTIEGFVLFDGLWQKGRLAVLRAIPPFDRPAFAENMINDMCLLFLTPRMASLTHVMQKEGDLVCRYRQSEDISIDMIIHEDQSWSIKVFSGHLLKEIQATSIGNNVPQFMELKGHAYTLKLTTIMAEPDSGGNMEDINTESCLKTGGESEI